MLIEDSWEELKNLVDDVKQNEEIISKEEGSMLTPLQIIYLYSMTYRQPDSVDLLTFNEQPSMEN
jgi:hypothetical protein